MQPILGSVTEAVINLFSSIAEGMKDSEEAKAPKELGSPGTPEIAEQCLQLVDHEWNRIELSEDTHSYCQLIGLYCVPKGTLYK